MTDDQRKDPLDGRDRQPGHDDHDDGPIEFLNREDDPNVDLDEWGDFEENSGPGVSDGDPDRELSDHQDTLLPYENLSDSIEKTEPEKEILMNETPETTPDPQEEMAKHRSKTFIRSLGGGRAGGPPWVMIGAAVVIAVIAAFMFWPRNSSSPADDDLGGQRSSIVMFGDSLGVAGIPVPRSSDVDLDDELPQVVPEHPEGAGSRPAEETRSELRQQLDTATDKGQLAEPQAVASSGTAPVTKRETDELTPATQGPSAGGQWAIQLGSFGSRANADKLATQLRDKGYRMEIQDLTANGGTIHRVWVGFFPTRTAAAAYAQLHRNDLGSETFITHR